MRTRAYVLVAIVSILKEKGREGAVTEDTPISAADRLGAALVGRLGESVTSLKTARTVGEYLDNIIEVGGEALG